MEPQTYPVREYESSPGPPPEAVRQERNRYWLHLLLFLLTLASTTYSGGQFAGRILRFEELGAWWFLPDGLAFGLSILLFLSVHEFGHYLAARRHRISVSLPYYIPMPLVLFGTLGAVIRIREPIPDTRKLFDVGVAGPVAGFVVALGLLLYALITLPPPAYMYDLPGHEEMKAYIARTGRFPAQMLPHDTADGTVVIVFGQTLLYQALSALFPNVPPMYEIYHYPVLLAGWLGLFFTALNLLPVGQLDGGHILYALFGPRKHSLLARFFVVFLLISGSIGFTNEVIPELHAYGLVMGGLSWLILAAVLYFFLFRVFAGEHRLIAPVLMGILLVAALSELAGDVLAGVGYTGWLVFSLLIVVFVRVDHPPVLYSRPLDANRRMLGYLSILIFFLCFSIRPIYIL